MAATIISLLTTGRADYGLVSPVARALSEDPAFSPRLLVAAAHLDADRGAAPARIQADGLSVAARIPWGEGTPVQRSARILAGVAEALTDDPPDALFVVGDRFEVLSAAQAAALVGVPVVHLGGGDVSEGAIDDGFRHALTKLSHLHLATHEGAARRIRQMGEDPTRVHVVGNPALDGLVHRAAMPPVELERLVGSPLGARNLLVTFHPVTLTDDLGMAEFEAVLAALERLEDGWTVWLSEPNDDPGGEALRTRLRAWAIKRPGVHVRAAFGPAFPALASRCVAVLGNSSAGLAETPSLGVPTVDVGLRQRGRLAGPGVIHAPARTDAILAALAQAQAMDRATIRNPYGDGASTPRIIRLLRDLPDRRALLTKRFHDLGDRA